MSSVFSTPDFVRSRRAYMLEHVRNAGNTFFGMPVYGQQVLSALSAILYLIAVLFLHTVIGRQTVQKQ